MLELQYFKKEVIDGVCAELNQTGFVQPYLATYRHGQQMLRFALSSNQLASERTKEYLRRIVAENQAEATALVEPAWEINFWENGEGRSVVVQRLWDDAGDPCNPYKQLLLECDEEVYLHRVVRVTFEYRMGRARSYMHTYIQTPSYRPAPWVVGCTSMLLHLAPHPYAEGAYELENSRELGTEYGDELPETLGRNLQIDCVPVESTISRRSLPGATSDDMLLLLSGGQKEQRDQPF